MKLAGKLLGGLVVFATGASIFYWMMHISENDQKKWEELKAKTTFEEKKEHFFSIKKKSSTREFLQDKTFIQFRSDHSEFRIQKKEQFEIEELLYQVEGIMQERYFVDEEGRKTEEKKIPMQKIRVWQAEKAFLNLKNHTIVAKNVHMQSYDLPDHILPKTFESNSSLSFVAANMTLCFKKDDFHMELESFQSNFQLNEFLR